MNVSKTQASAAPIRHERTDAMQKSKATPITENKQVQPQAVEAHKATEVKPQGVQKGGEINITA
jgi:hypothetical protein